MRVPAERVDELRLDVRVRRACRRPAASASRSSTAPRSAPPSSSSTSTTAARSKASWRGPSSTIGEVASARVHIAMAKDSLFAESAPSRPRRRSCCKLRNNRAAAAGDRRRHRRPRRRQRRIAAARVGRHRRHLRPAARRGPDEADDAGAGGLQLERQQRIERDLTTKVVALLEPVVGAGRVRVNVSARARPPTRRRRPKKRWDPTPVVRSRQSRRTRRAGDASARRRARRRRGRRPRQRAARRRRPPIRRPSQAPAQRRHAGPRRPRRTNYEISKTTRAHRRAAAGRSRGCRSRSSSTTTRDADGADGQPASEQAARAPRSCERIQGLVAAVGRPRHRARRPADGREHRVRRRRRDDRSRARRSPWWQQVSPTVVSTLGVSVGACCAGRSSSLWRWSRSSACSGR